MAIQVMVAGGGKMPSSATWTPSGVPTNTSDLQITSATTGKAEIAGTGVTCRSCNFATYTGEWKQESAIKIGGASTGEGSNANVALKLSAGMAYNIASGSPSILFKGTSGVVEGIWPAGHTFPPVEVSPTASGLKLRLEEGMNTSSVLHTRGELDLNGKTCEWGKYVSEGTATRALTGGAATIKLTGTGTVWNLDTISGMTLSMASATLEATGSEPTIITGDFASSSYGTIICAGTVKTVIGPRISITGGASLIGTLAIRSDVQIKATTILNIGTTITTDAKAGTKRKLTSTEAASSASISLNGKTIHLDYIEARDVQVVEGTLWLGPNSVDLGGNSGNLKFEHEYADSGAGSRTIGGSGTESVQHSGTGTATHTAGGSGTDSLIFADVRSGSIGASGSGSDSLTCVDHGSGACTINGIGSESSESTGAQSVSVTVSGSGSDAIEFADAGAAVDVVSGTGTDVYVGTDAGTVVRIVIGSGYDEWFEGDGGTVLRLVSGGSNEVYEAIDVGDGTAIVSGAGMDSWTLMDSGEVRVTASGGGTDSYSISEAGSGARIVGGSGFDSHTAIDAGQGATNVTGSGVELIEFVDHATGVAMAGGSGVDAWEPPPQPTRIIIRDRPSASIVIRDRPSARVKITDRR